MRAYSPLWRALVPVTVAVAALLLVTSAITARGTDLRSSQTVQVSERIRAEEQTVGDLTHEIDALRADVSRTTVEVARGSRGVAKADAEAARLEAAAGLTPLRGPALTVALNDAPKSLQSRDEGKGAQPDDLVIHQQDVQGVVNALWAGGADGMTIMGERVVATTAVRCVGNTLLLHGRVYGPPFVITAVGDVTALQDALNADPTVSIFKEYVAAYGLGYDVTTSALVTLPAYGGPLELSHAKAM